MNARQHALKQVFTLRSLDMASPPPSPNPSEKEALLTNEMESVDFASLLADLESMPHTNINARPIGKAGSRKPNDFGVRVTLKLHPRKQKRFAVTKPDGERPTLVAAAREAVKWATGELKAAGIEAPEATPQAPQPPTPEELQQLTEWIDDQSDPEAITIEQADAWLRGRRASASGAGAMAPLIERQLAEATLRTMEARFKRAEAALARAKAALPEEQASKRQKPAWSGREYAGYDTVDIWRQEEGRIFNQRRVELSADKQGRVPSKLPKGAEGALHHWRCGLVGAVKYWAQGSTADAVHFLFALDLFDSQVDP